MHDRAARPAGAVKSAAAVASEIIILPNINLRIAQVRPRVEESVQTLVALIVSLLLLAIGIMITMPSTSRLRRSFQHALVSAENFRRCDRYVSCNYREQGK